MALIGKSALEIQLFIAHHIGIEMRKSIKDCLILQDYFIYYFVISTLSIYVFRDFLNTECRTFSWMASLFAEARGNEYFTLHFARALWFLNQTWETGPKNFPHFCFFLFSSRCFLH